MFTCLVREKWRDFLFVGVNLYRELCPANMNMKLAALIFSVCASFISTLHRLGDFLFIGFSFPDLEASPILSQREDIYIVCIYIGSVA